MLLVYYRTYVASILLGFIFSLDQSNVPKDIRILEPLVKIVVPLPEKLHEMARRARTPEEVEKFFPGSRAFVDATEQEIPRPKDSRKRKSHYSGKRKRHTVKTQLTVNGKGLILQRTNHARGRRHDYGIFKGNRPKLPEGVRPGVDLGYDGIPRRLPGAQGGHTLQEEGSEEQEGQGSPPGRRGSTGPCPRPGWSLTTRYRG